MTENRLPLFRRPTHLLAATLLAAVCSAGCSPGSAAKAVRSDAPTAADALGDACMNPDEPTEPWTFDLDTTQRGQLTTALRKHGLVLVAYDCDGLRVVRGCKATGDYEYAAYPAAWDVIDLRDTDEVRASLSGGAVFAAELKAEMERGTALVIAHGEIGMSSTTVMEISRDRLRGKRCDEATHFVEAVHFGAFAMQTSSEAELGSAIEIFDQGASAASASSAKKSKRSGKREACERSSSEDRKPVAGCDAVVRVRLVPLAKASGDAPKPPPPPGFSRPASCPPGMVRVSHRCVSQRRAKSFDCRPGDASGCRRECQRGSLASCSNLGLMYERGAGVQQSPTQARSFYERACEGGHQPGCTGLAYLYSKGAGVKRDVARARRMFDKGCRRGDARACSGLAQQARVAGKLTVAIPKFARACRLGYARACFYEGAMLLKQKKHDQRALKPFERACRGADFRGCLSAAYLLQRRPGKVSKAAGRYLARGRSGLSFACDKKRDADACETLADFYRGEYGAQHKNPKNADRYAKKACRLGRKKACRR